MDGSSLGVFTAIGATIAKIAVALFVLVNGAFIAFVVMRRDRGLVDRWTRRLVVADTALLLAAGGAPVAAWAACGDQSHPTGSDSGSRKATRPGSTPGVPILLQPVTWAAFLSRSTGDG